MPINVTLLFSGEHYIAAAEAYLRGIERRVKAGLDPKVESVASVFVSRWDVVVKEDVQPQLHNRLGVAVAMRTYRAHCDLLASERWQLLVAAGARPQRLLWASTGMKDPAAPDTFYVEALAARLQSEGVQAFAKSWGGLMARIREKSPQPTVTAARVGAA